jgi:hypothetical protein
MQPPVAADDPTIEVPPLPSGGRHVIVITEVPYQISKVWTLSHLGESLMTRYLHPHLFLLTQVCLVLRLPRKV